VIFGVFFWLHNFFQNNIEIYVYLEICLQIKCRRCRKVPIISYVNYVTLSAANIAIIYDIALLGNIKSLQSLHLKIINQKETLYAVIVVKNIRQEWVYGNTPRNVPVKYQANQ
jgi:hypothetical protein